MSFRFTWAHPAEQVFVTGTFDNWSKSVELEKKGGIFEKTVSLPATTEKIFYKFVIDGAWDTDHTAKTDTDHEGNVNNVLYPSDLTPTTSSAAISSVAPSSTTAAMAGEQPLATPNPIGAFPMTPGGEEDKQLSVNPIAASSGTGNPIKLAQGEPVPHSSTFTSNSITSGVHDDPELVAADQAKNQSFSVSPIPATTGLSNPVNLAQGEPVPHSSSLTSNTIDSNVKLDKASYESSAPVLPPALSPQSEREAFGAPIFGLGPQAGTAVIPEIGFPVTATSESDTLLPNMSSVGPTSTTNQLAGAVPLEPRGVPEVVSESQSAAHASPEASANSEAVVEKSEMEQELKSKVPEEPATSESGMFGKSERGVTGAVAGGLAGAAATATAAISSVMGNSTTNKLAGQAPIEERGVPELVSESQQAAHASPEASSNREAVVEKNEVEQELKSKVPEEPATSESGMFGKSEKGWTGAIAGGVAATGAAAAATGYALREKTKETTGRDPVAVLPQSTQDSINANQPITSATIRDVAQDTGVPESYMGSTGARETTSTVPAVVTASQKRDAHSSEASGNLKAVREKQQVENELLSKVKEDDSHGQPAPKVVADYPDGSAARETTGVLPGRVVASQKADAKDPEATMNPEVIREKQQVENELLSKVKEDDSQGKPAPVSSAALSETAPAATTSSTGAPQLNPITSTAPIDLGANGLNASADSPAVPSSTKENKAPVSGDVSPMTNVENPTVTTGVASSQAPTRSTPEKRNSFMDRLKSTPDSSGEASTDSDGKKKRKGFFGKIKEKFK